MLEVEQLAYALAQEYPQLVRCRDYWVAHPVDLRTLEQTGPAWIVEWNPVDIPKPTPDDIDALWAKYGAECLTTQAAAAARAQRDALLINADRLVETAIDREDKAAESTARKYRQALRDVPQQAGFPLDIDWPPPPGK
jgi:CTP:molybdopterin cytidylyltransferase MocA